MLEKDKIFVFCCGGIDGTFGGICAFSKANSCRRILFFLRTVITDRVRYIMREYNGKLAVFNDDGTVYKVYEINVELLPEYDRKILKKGIQITGEEELRARVEDYTS